MKIILQLALLVVFIQAVVLFRLWGEKQLFREASMQIEQVRSDLAGALEACRDHQTKEQSLKDEIVRLHQELEHTKPALISAGSAQTASSLVSEVERNRQPLGLTADDFDPKSIRVAGTNDSGILTAHFVGKSSEEIGVLETRHQPLVLGHLISRDGFVRLIREGTNIGLGLRFGSRAEAEVIAAEMRGQSTQ